MKFDISINIYHHHDNINQGMIMSALSNITTQVANANTVTESAIALLQGLKSQLDAAIASGDPAQIQTLADSLGSETGKLSAAITANTPADPVAVAAAAASAAQAAQAAADAAQAAADAAQKAKDKQAADAAQEAADAAQIAAAAQAQAATDAQAAVDAAAAATAAADAGTPAATGITTMSQPLAPTP